MTPSLAIRLHWEVSDRSRLRRTSFYEDFMIKKWILISAFFISLPSFASYSCISYGVPSKPYEQGYRVVGFFQVYEVDATSQWEALQITDAILKNTITDSAAVEKIQNNDYEIECN